MASSLPRGIGLDVSGRVDAVGEGVSNVHVGDRVLGIPDFLGHASAGAAEYAVLSVWVPVPDGLSLPDAAALPMAVETAARTLDILGLKKGQTILINGGGTMVGFAAVQMACFEVPTWLQLLERPSRVACGTSVRGDAVWRRHGGSGSETRGRNARLGPANRNGLWRIARPDQACRQRPSTNHEHWGSEP